MFFCCKKNLDKHNWKNTQPFVPNVKYGKVIKVYDGDTITIVSKPYRREPPYRFTIRLNHIDCPEMNSKDDNEWEAAHIVQEQLSHKILNKYVTIKNRSIEKYGRLLCDVYLKNECINDWLLENRYAVKYEGKKKSVPVNWMNYLENGNMD